MRVRLEGELRIDTWDDKNNPGETVSGMALTASLISIMPHRLESVTLKTRQGSPGENNAPSQGESEF